MVWWKPAGRAECVVGQPMRSCVPYLESSWRSVTSLPAVYAAVRAFCMHATDVMAAFVNTVYVMPIALYHVCPLTGAHKCPALCVPLAKVLVATANKFMSMIMKMTKQRLQLACMCTVTCSDLQSYATAAKGFQTLCRSTGRADSTRSTPPSLPP